MNCNDGKEKSALLLKTFIWINKRFHQMVLIKAAAAAAACMYSWFSLSPCLFYTNVWANANFGVAWWKQMKQQNYFFVRCSRDATRSRWSLMLSFSGKETLVCENMESGFHHSPCSLDFSWLQKPVCLQPKVHTRMQNSRPCHDEKQIASPQRSRWFKSFLKLIFPRISYSQFSVW